MKPYVSLWCMGGLLFFTSQASADPLALRLTTSAPPLTIDETGCTITFGEATLEGCAANVDALNTVGGVSYLRAALPVAGGIALLVANGSETHAQLLALTAPLAAPPILAPTWLAALTTNGELVGFAGATERFRLQLSTSLAGNERPQTSLLSAWGSGVLIALPDGRRSYVDADGKLTRLTKGSALVSPAATASDGKLLALTTDGALLRFYPGEIDAEQLLPPSRERPSTGLTVWHTQSGDALAWGDMNGCLHLISRGALGDLEEQTTSFCSGAPFLSALATFYDEQSNRLALTGFSDGAQLIVRDNGPGGAGRSAELVRTATRYQMTTVVAPASGAAYRLVTAGGGDQQNPTIALASHSLLQGSVMFAGSELSADGIGPQVFGAIPLALSDSAASETAASTSAAPGKGCTQSPPSLLLLILLAIVFKPKARS